MTGPRVYPLPPPDVPDPRFAALADVVAVEVAAHGFPPVRGMDLVELQQALWGFFYLPREVEQ